MVNEKKEVIPVKVRCDADYFYVQYGNSAEWEKIHPEDLPSSIRAILRTLVSDEYEVDFV